MRKRISRRTFLRLAGAVGGVSLVSSYPFFIERYLIFTNTYRIPVPNLPESFEGFRIVQLTDLHHGFLVPIRVIEHVVARANNIERDITVCTGDYVHEDDGTSEIDRVWPVLGKLEAAGGVYSVLGNHDHWADTERSQYWLDRTGQDLQHRAIPLDRGSDRIWLAGVGDFWEDVSSPDAVLQGIPEDECRIVLAHNPDTADLNYDARVDLMIAGHTHGGQVIVPFIGPPRLPVRNKNYSSGLKHSPRGTPVFISRGIGWAIIPVRFNCPPEIAVLELTRA